MEYKGSGHMLCGGSVSWSRGPLYPGSRVVPSSPHVGGSVVRDWIGWKFSMGKEASSSSHDVKDVH